MLANMVCSNIFVVSGNHELVASSRLTWIQFSVSIDWNKRLMIKLNLQHVQLTCEENDGPFDCGHVSHFSLIDLRQVRNCVTISERTKIVLWANIFNYYHYFNATIFGALVFFLLCQNKCNKFSLSFKILGSNSVIHCLCFMSRNWENKVKVSIIAFALALWFIPRLANGDLNLSFSYA